MGGTSTDVSRYAGKLELVYKSVTAQAPQLDSNTVAAGGESMFFWQNGPHTIISPSADAARNRQL